MNAIASFTIVPISSGISLTPYIAACKKILKNSELTCEFHANGSNIEGEWDDIFRVIKECQIKVHEMGAKRVFTTIQVGTRLDKEHKMIDKQASVDHYLREENRGLRD